jgi:cytochrome oxidase Cu insertion factor (SCO1/SenC/PrrC family)
MPPLRSGADLEFPMLRLNWKWTGLSLIGMLALAAAMLLWTRTDGARAANETGDEVWGANHFPNVVLTDQFGRKHKFYDDLIKGKVVAVSFVFTSCAASCSLETARMREVQQLLGDRVGKDVFFYSLTIDPLTDTPDVLKKYADQFGVGPGWLFLTGADKDIELVRRRLGVFDDGDVGKDRNEHSLHTVIGNQASGRWMRGSPFENPYVTAMQIGSWLHNYKLPETLGADYKQAPSKMATMSKGETLFRSRCSSCHTIAGKAQVGMARVGPDLKGVLERRPRAWLMRWLKEPDRMLAEKDPQAIALYNQFNKVAMPNMRLDIGEINDLLTFLDEASRSDQYAKRAAME